MSELCSIIRTFSETELIFGVLKGCDLNSRSYFWPWFRTLISRSWIAILTFSSSAVIDLLVSSVSTPVTERSSLILHCLDFVLNSTKHLGPAVSVLDTQNWSCYQYFLWQPTRSGLQFSIFHWHLFTAHRLRPKRETKLWLTWSGFWTTTRPFDRRTLHSLPKSERAEGSPGLLPLCLLRLKLW